jgi:hypothetical protein
MSGFEYVIGPSIIDDPNLADNYVDMMSDISTMYKTLVDAGANKQDARGVLPTNIATNIVMKANLRSLHDMALKRLCVKAQGEAQDVFRAMIDEVVKVHPYFKDFLRVWCATYGTCCFPTFPVEDCPTKPIVYNPETTVSYSGGIPGTLDEIYKSHNAHRAEAQPGVVKADDN